MTLALSHFPSPDEWAMGVGVFVLALLALGGLLGAVFGGRGRR